MSKSKNIPSLAEEATALLQKLIAIPSLSRQEDKTADEIEAFLKAYDIPCHRQGNNVWAFNKHYDKTKMNILLNSHHDTVKPNPGWTKDPFNPEVADGKLYGLGSNDAGGCLVSLLATFLYFYDDGNLNSNLVFAATAEEEVSGIHGLESILPQLGNLDFAVVGEPTLMDMAIAEKGLMVLDCTAHGKAGHAAREEGENTIYKALQDIEWFKNYRFEKVSPYLGPIKMTVTVINAGSQHNVVPDECHFTVDIRLTEQYTHQEVLDTIRQHVQSEIKPRSLRLRPSSIPLEHPFVQAGLAMGRKTYGSPTTSDQALIDGPSIKIGPGDSARSHTADEFIYLREIEEGVRIYVEILEKILN